LSVWLDVNIIWVIPDDLVINYFPFNKFSNSESKIEWLLIKCIDFIFFEGEKLRLMNSELNRHHSIINNFLDCLIISIFNLQGTWSLFIPLNLISILPAFYLIILFVVFLLLLNVNLINIFRILKLLLAVLIRPWLSFKSFFCALLVLLSLFF
jgi:hypothetical protein